MQQMILLIHILVCVGIIGFVLVQHGKGAQAGAAFGSGASQTVFGSQGSGSFLTRSTAILATVFFITSLTLGYLTTKGNKPASIQEFINRATGEQSVLEVFQKSETKKQAVETDVPAVPE